MTIVVKVWSDFVCPFCLIAEQPLRQAIAAVDGDVTLQWMPFELRPAPTPTLRPEDDYLQTIWAQSVLPLAAAHGVPLQLPSVSPQPHTALAWEGFQFAAQHGLGNAYNDAVLAAFFQQNRDIGQIEVLADIAKQIGLDADAFSAALRDRHFQQAHQQALEQAEVEGVTSVPTMHIGGRRLRGVQPQDRLIAALFEAGARPRG
ncbi:DsbA family oxidoreductase [Piscinibacter sakaiensis]|uniref:DsbA family oxidoreductase n=1 Tax=Piscinibacter sakaiensis TaxID=1547922 RepID=UPI003AAC922B